AGLQPELKVGRELPAWHALRAEYQQLTCHAPLVVGPLVPELEAAIEPETEVAARTEQAGEQRVAGGGVTALRGIAPRPRCVALPRRGQVRGHTHGHEGDKREAEVSHGWTHPGPGTGYQLYLKRPAGPWNIRAVPTPTTLCAAGSSVAGAFPRRAVKIISRYVLREHAGPLIFAMSALTSLLLLNYVAKQLPQLVGKGLPWTVIAEFVLLAMPFTIAMTLPMAVLVATLHAFSRLAADSEITAFKASGLALPRLMLPVVVAGFLLSLTMVWFNDQVMPAANFQLQTLMNDIARKKPTFALRPQVINEVA